MHKTVVINTVGLTPKLLAHAPAISHFQRHAKSARINEAIPAVTTTMQSTFLTGKTPREHGIVGNGWYDRSDAEIKFWKQSNHLVKGEKIWERAKRADPNFTCANICWWYAMYSSCGVTVTPRPMYPADGRKLPDCWTWPPALRDDLQNRFGPFPLFRFWGPMASIESTRWIVDSSIHVDQKFDPTLTLIYLPHLDYALQKFGPDHPEVVSEVKKLDQEAVNLFTHYKDKARIIVLSEYGITNVSRPVHINRILREMDLITVRDELGKELLDAGASKTFAVADHQIAHVYVNETSALQRIEEQLRNTDGVMHVYSGEARKEINLDHERAGDIVVLARHDAWFTYYYWLDDSRAPDFARTVDIHRKPGYDPCELFIDPKLFAPKFRIARKVFARKLGFRNLLDLISLDASLVKGSHGIPASSAENAPMLVTNAPIKLPAEIKATDVYDVIWDSLTK